MKRLHGESEVWKMNEKKVKEANKVAASKLTKEKRGR